MHIPFPFPLGRYSKGEFVSLPATLSHKDLQAKVVQYFPNLAGQELSFFKAVGFRNILVRLMGSVADFRRQGLRNSTLYIKASSEVG